MNNSAGEADDASDSAVTRDEFADVAASKGPAITVNAVFAAKDVTAASCKEDALAPENAGRGNRRTTHGRSRCKQCIPRVRGGLVLGQDGSNAVVSAGLTLDEVRYVAIQPRTRLRFIPKRAPASSSGARTIQTASAQPSAKTIVAV